jgi:hypothetical protein
MTELNIAHMMTVFLIGILLFIIAYGDNDERH